MNDVLARICAQKRADVERRMRDASITDVAAAAANAPPPKGFAARLAAAVASGTYGLIAEIKRASPSKGLIRADFDPAGLARAYAAGGATCLSVLTDVRFFGGADEHLRMTRAAVDLPVLRKDFLLHPYQIFEARVLGADCVLLILAALNDDQTCELAAVADDLGMDVLIEVHNPAELDRALTYDARLIGINNRDLTSLTVNIATTETLAPLVPSGPLVVSESGLSTPNDLARMANVGVRCFLIGESLMRQVDVEAATRALLSSIPRATAQQTP